MLQAKNISKSFGVKRVFQNLNITVKQGEVTVLMGKNGSGKSTCLRSLALLEKIDSGQIMLDGTSVNASDVNMYPKITVVFQQLFLWPHLTNRENITLAVQGTPYQKQLDELIEFLDLKEFIDQYPNQSSLGQKQRVAIARALILNPQYLLLDEITSALDDRQTEVIVEILKDLKKRKIGILLVTHHKVVAKQLADKLVYI